MQWSKSCAVCPTAISKIGHNIIVVVSLCEFLVHTPSGLLPIVIANNNMPQANTKNVASTCTMYIYMYLFNDYDNMWAPSVYAQQ